MRNNPIRLFVCLCLLLLASVASAAIDVYEFQNENDRTRFHKLTGELRCPKCQNQNIADSNAPIAQDLRTKIQTMLTENKTDQEIVDYMIGRYGDFVLYQPRVDKKTYLLWFGPVVLLVLGLLVVIFISRRNADRNKTDQLNTTALDAAQQQQLATLLSDLSETEGVSATANHSGTQNPGTHKHPRRHK